MLPLAMGYGALSGLGLVAGIYGAVAVAFFAGLCHGTRGMVSGPTLPAAAAMTVIVAMYGDDLAAVAAIVILSGLIQIIVGLLSALRAWGVLSPARPTPSSPA